jgi:hypothetical protein
MTGRLLSSMAQLWYASALPFSAQGGIENSKKRGKNTALPKKCRIFAPNIFKQTFLTKDLEQNDY